MDIHVEEKSGCEKILLIEVLPDEFNPTLEQEYEKYRKRVRIEGFRKGKAPLSLIKRVYGKEIEATTLDELIQKVYRQALEKESLNPVSQGIIENVEFEPDKHLKFKVQVEVEPSFELGEISGLKVIKEVKKVEEKDIDNEIERLRYMLATRETVEGPAEQGHYFIADLQKVDPSTRIPIVGQKFEERYLKLSLEDLGEEWFEQLIGVKAGEGRFLIKKFPNDFHIQNLAGKEEAYIMNVKSVERLILPVLDDEFAKDVSDETSTLNELKDRIRKELEQKAEQEAEEKMYRNLENELLRRYDFDVPPKMLDTFLNQSVEEIKKNSKENIDDGYVKNVNRPDAVRLLRWHFIREKLIMKNSIQVSDQEVENRIEILANNQNMNRQKALMLLRSKKNKQQVYDKILEEKIREVLKNAAEILTVMV